MKIGAENFGAELVKAVTEYTKDVESAIEEEINDTADNVLKEIKSSKSWNDRTGRYRKGFKKKRVKSRGEIRNTIYNNEKPQAVHLLEFGHVLKDGKRAQARPHMKPAYDKHVPEMEKRIEEIIKKGGKS